MERIPSYLLKVCIISILHSLNDIPYLYVCFKLFHEFHSPLCWDKTTKIAHLNECNYHINDLVFGENGYLFGIEKCSSRNFIGIHKRYFSQLCQNLGFLSGSYILDPFLCALNRNGPGLKCIKHIQIKCLLVCMHNGQNFRISWKLNRVEEHFHHWIYNGSVLQII